MVTRKTRRMVTRAALWAVVLLVAVAVVFLGSSTWRVYSRMLEVQELRAQAEAERGELILDNERLTASLKALSTERGVEAEIRSRYPLVKPGEVEFVLVGNDENPTVDTASTTGDSVWSSFRAWLGR